MGLSPCYFGDQQSAANCKLEAGALQHVSDAPSLGDVQPLGNDYKAKLKRNMHLTVLRLGQSTAKLKHSSTTRV